MTTLITRDQMRPGQIVQRVSTQTYRVRSARWSDDNASKRAGLRKLDHLSLDHLSPDRVEWQLIRGRWRVYWRPPFRHLGTRVNGFWIAEEQDRGGGEWRAFDTWAEAISYADRMARQAL